MTTKKRMHAARMGGDPVSQLQIIARQISSISALFTMLVAIITPGAHWVMVVILAALYIGYNMYLSLKRAKPHLGELAIDLLLCAGLTISGAMYSNVLYYLLLMRMVLKVGRDRAWRMTIAVSSVYLLANAIVCDGVSLTFLMERLYNVLGFSVLAFTAIYMLNVVTLQLKHEGKIAELMKENAHHYELAHTDELTGLLNHRAYLEKTAELQQYVLLVVDIDHFKKLNDTYGHLFGDQVLSTVGNIIKTFVRGKDMAFRYGGEEFALVFPDIPLELGLKIAEKLRFQVANCDFYHNNERVKITISIGLSRKKPSIASQDAFREADSALYRAKRQGRNQCAVF